MPSKRSPNPLRTVITRNNLNPTTLVRIQIILKNTWGFKARHKMVLLNKVLTTVATSSNTEGDPPATTSNLIRDSPVVTLAKTPRQPQGYNRGPVDNPSSSDKSYKSEKR